MTKTVLITGANRGIGFHLAAQFAKHQYEVIGTSRSVLIKNLNNIEVLQLDLSNQNSLNDIKNTLTQKDTKIDLLINNAGIGPDLEMDKPTEETFRDTFEVNVTGTTFFTEMMIPMVKQGGKIINISSKMGSVENCKTSGSVAYRMSKSALNMYTKILTNQLIDSHKIASIHPGWVRTNISKSTSIHGRLSPEDSAERIFKFITSDFETGIFWDVEYDEKIEW